MSRIGHVAALFIVKQTIIASRIHRSGVHDLCGCSVSEGEHKLFFLGGALLVKDAAVNSYTPPSSPHKYREGGREIENVF